MLSAESFQATSLRLAREGESITRILAASIRAVEPGAAVERFVRRSGDFLTVAGREYHLADYRSVRLLGIGKASIAMSTRLAGILGVRLEAGLVITKHVSAVPQFPFTILAGGHPVPDAYSLEAGRKTMEFVSTLGPNDLLFCLVSGGGSSLVTAPLEGISLEDVQALTTTLLACGARIDEINSLRRRLDWIKGGGLVRLSNGAGIVSLILSDVVGSPLEAIASGPTAPDPTRRADVLALVKKYGLRGKIPGSILATLEQVPETPKPDDPLFEKVQNVIVGNSLLAAQAALTQAGMEGFHPYLLRIDMQGEARQVAFELATFLRQAKRTGDPVPRPACIMVGGETTVTLRQVSPVPATLAQAGQAPREKGKGGRNTELALAAVTELADFPGVMLVTLATDGEDGPTDAAGAVVTGETFRRAAGLAMHPDDYLYRNDSYSFFAALDDLLKPGPTGTNVNDLAFLFVL
jgi:hydroxypyruvate reductase